MLWISLSLVWCLVASRVRTARFHQVESRRACIGRGLALWISQLVFRKNRCERLLGEQLNCRPRVQR